MTDHETYLLLAAKQISEPLTAEEEADLATHLAACPACRSKAAGMRRDELAMHAQLVQATVAPSVRQRVLAEAHGRRGIDPRLILGLAAVLLIGAIAGPLLIGARVESEPLPSATLPSLALAPTHTPDPSPASSRSVAPPSLVIPALSASPEQPLPFVVGNYVYGTTPPRRDTLAAHFEGKPVGEWSRRTPATGDSQFFGGPVTCLVIEGSDAWLAGPATTATDAGTVAAFIHVTDGGPDGQGDTAFLWRAEGGQTLVTMTEWCEKRFIPAPGLPLTSGDVVVRSSP